VHSKKRKSDHQHFANNRLTQRPRPRDLLDQSRDSEASRDLRASRDFGPSKGQQPPTSPRRKPEAVPSSPRRRRPPRESSGRPDSDERVGRSAEQFLPVLEDLDDPDPAGGDSVAGGSPVDKDNMAGDPARIAMARRGKLVTFYRNGDTYYKVYHVDTR